FLAFHGHLLVNPTRFEDTVSIGEHEYVFWTTCKGISRHHNVSSRRVAPRATFKFAVLQSSSRSITPIWFPSLCMVSNSKNSFLENIL
ncbi:hypothetical protein L9F63_007908, partial [Diploptera punctata]